MARQFRQQYRQQTQQRHVGAEAVDEFYAFAICKYAEDCGTYASEAECEAEEHACYEADAAGDEFLGKDHDG